jgi:hypothetical protein
VFIGAHELHPHGAARELRQQRGRQRHIVVATVAVGARALAELHADLLRWQAHQRGDATACGVDILRGADDQSAFRLNVGERAVGRKRCVRLVRRIAPLHHGGRGFVGRHANVTALQHHVVGGSGRVHLCVQARGR